jgi:uncharacterized protein YndB with AHSA1/START domain
VRKKKLFADRRGEAYCTSGRKARPPEVALTRRPDLPRAENMVVIAVPITEVFAYIADGTNNPQWRPGVMDITPPEDGPDEGAVYGQGLRGPKGQRIDGDYRITDYQPPNRLAFEVIAGPARPTGTFDLEEPVAGATMVRFSLDLQGKGLMKVPMRFAGKVIERQMRAEVDCLSRLKDQLEAGPDEEEAEDEAEAETPEA